VGEEEREGAKGRSPNGPVGLLGQLGGMGEKATRSEERKRKLDFNFKLISRFRKK
jgi:hypothetical protein